MFYFRRGGGRDRLRSNSKGRRGGHAVDSRSLDVRGNFRRVLWLHVNSLHV